jgi:phosphoribosyl 1,2-cyclic phosphate phosphodiesterase
MLSFKDVNVVVDVGPDFRQQMLREEVKHLDAVLITHEHNDHVVGMDDIRPFNFRQRLDMPVYALDRVLREIKAKFFYIFDANPYPGSPRVVCHPIFPGQPFSLSKGMQIAIACRFWYDKLEQISTGSELREEPEWQRC